MCKIDIINGKIVIFSYILLLISICAYKVPTSIGALQGLYEGHAYFYMDKTSQTASLRISLHYAHDYSSSMNVSYSINIGVYGSISINGNVEKINQMADNFEVVGLLS